MDFTYGAHTKIYWKCLHVMCACYDGLDVYEKNIETMTAMAGFIKIFAMLIPNTLWSKWMTDFIEMNETTFNEVLSNDVMRVYHNSRRPAPLEEYIMNSKNTCALEWSWSLHEYINYKRRKNGEKIQSLSFTDIKSMYNIRHITKDVWGRPMWFVLHTFSLYSPPLTNDLKLAWKAFVSSLQYVLPCPICKEHVRQNMLAINIENFLSTPKKLFEWTWRLHNTVNVSKDYKTRALSLQEAEEIYTKLDQQELSLIFL